MLMHRLGRLTVRLASLLATLVLVGGLPTVLATVVGWPLPRRVPTDWAGWAHLLTGGFPDQAVTNLLAIALWLVWVAFGYSLLGELLAARWGRPARRLRVISPMQALAALLVAGMSAGPAAASVAVLGPTAPVVATAPASSAPLAPPTPATGSAPWRSVTVTPGPAPTLAASVVDLPPTAVPAATTAGLPRFAVAAQTGPLTLDAGGHHYAVTVHRGDTLWDIAGQWLADPHRWPEIYHLNADRYDQHGRMRGGDHIETDWVLTLPDDATPPPGAQPTTPLHQDEPSANAPAGPGSSPAVAPTGVPAPSGGTTPPPATNSASPAPSATPSPANPGGQPSTTGDPDGVAGPPPAGVTLASPSAASTSPSAADSAAARGPAAQPDRPHGVSLPSGSWLDLGLAAAIAAAATLVWAHRRRRYTRRPLSADLRWGDPECAPMPPVVNQVRRGLRRAASVADRHEDLPDDNGLDLLTTDDNDPLDGTDPIDTRQPRAGGSDDLDDDLNIGLVGDEDDRATEAQDEPATPDDNDPLDPDQAASRPAVPSLTHPLSAVWPPAGLGLTGPGAEASARGFLAAALAAGGLDDPDARSRVVMPSATATTLLGAAAVTLPSTPRLTVTAGLDDALDLLEAQTLHRSRLVYSHEVDTVAELRHVDPTEEPLPPILLIADATTRHQRTRVAALLTQGQRLDIHGVLLGAWPDGNTVVVAADGTTTAAEGDGVRHGHHPANIGRLAVLTPGETADLLVTLAESHTGQPQAAAPVEPAAPPAATPTTRVPPRSRDADAGAVDPNGEAPSRETAPKADRAQATPQTVDGSVPSDASTQQVRTGAQPMPAGAPAGPARVDTRPDAPDRAEAIPDADADRDPTGNADGGRAPGNSGPRRPGRVEVTVLGAPTIVDADPQRPLRKKSLELLVYLAVHDGEAPTEAILDDLLPDAPASKAPGRLYTYVSDLRTVLRHTGGPGSYLTHPDHRYVLNPQAIAVDLWRMRGAIRDAQQATDQTARIEALRRAVDTYRGHLAADADYEWIEPYREAVRQQALDAFLALADALAGSPAEQVTVLDAAIHHNPYAEELYQHAMRARAALGHLDAIRTLRRALTRALAEIDAEPSDDTIALADQLVARVQHAGRRPDLRPAPHPGDGAAA